ncbi:UNVERIFIED_CONTAM: hypothetical protein Slati_2196000 [Sesamum latifolium]|uniref:Uncharacterized protein n=1 Tax=Sesamum latifolium TaxID=2727402 RepID=A0AAW2WT63_9LAMI
MTLLQTPSPVLLPLRRKILLKTQPPWRGRGGSETFPPSPPPPPQQQLISQREVFQARGIQKGRRRMLPLTFQKALPIILLLQPPCQRALLLPPQAPRT